jgi:hypothetical protein
MPAPQPEALSTSAKQTFAGKNIALPIQWQTMGIQYPDAFSPAELSTPANASDNLYHEPTLNQYHTQAAWVLGRSYERFIDGICAAICDAIDTWMHSASIVTVTLTGTIGTVLPEATIGPQLKPLIEAIAPRATDQEKKYSDAIATAVSDNWELWQTGLSGILTYPPFGPPGPNIPTPLITFTSTGEANLAPDYLADEMARNLNDDGALHAKELFDSVAQALYAHFQIFKTNTMVAGVIMTPPVPPPPEPVIPEEPEPEEAEEDESLDPEAEEAAETDEAEAEPAPEPEPEPEVEPVPEPEPEPLPGGIVIPTPGNFV